MYTILINNDNTIISTVKTPIMQRSSLVDNIHILTPRMYKGIDMNEYRVIMEYILPVSKKYKYIELTKKNENYNNEFLEYVIDGSTEFTAESGEIKITFTFFKIEQTQEGKIQQKVRKTDEGVIYITPTTAWSDFIPDEVLAPLDQRLIAIEAVTAQCAEIMEKYEQLQNSGNSTLKISNELGNALIQKDDGLYVQTINIDSELKDYFEENPIEASVKEIYYGAEPPTDENAVIWIDEDSETN